MFHFLGGADQGGISFLLLNQFLPLSEQSLHGLARLTPGGFIEHLENPFQALDVLLGFLEMFLNGLS